MDLLPRIRRLRLTFILFWILFFSLARGPETDILLLAALLWDAGTNEKMLFHSQSMIKYILYRKKQFHITFCHR